MVGDGPQKAELENKTKTLSNLKDKVIFVGRQDNVLPYIYVSDIAILPSKRESFGLALLEPMACGLPVLGSNVGGIPEVISDKKTGYLFENKNVNQIALCIEKLANNKELRMLIGNAARERAISVFSRKEIVDSYEELYLGLMRQ